MFDAIVQLNTITVATNQYGDEAKTTTQRQVFAKVKSVGMKEKYLAMEYGLNPEVVFVLPDYLDYSNEDFIEHEGTTYKVIRTFRQGKEIEVICTRTGTPGTAKITPTTDVYDGSDLVFTVAGLTDVKKGSTSITYTYKYQTLTIAKEYLAINAPCTLTAVTEFGNVNFTVTV